MSLAKDLEYTEELSEAIGPGRVYDVVVFPHRWLVKPAPTAFLSHRNSVGKHLINILLNTLDSSVGAGFTNNI